MSHRISDLERCLNNIVRIGTVLDADYAKARIRVGIGGNSTAWLPWISQRAGDDKIWHPPGIGEQVVVVSPSGELAAGIVLPGGIYKNDRPPNGDKGTISRTTYGDGAVMQYDRKSHSQTIMLPAGGEIFIKVGDKENLRAVIGPRKIGLEVGYTQIFISNGDIRMRSGFNEIIISEKDGIKISGPQTSLTMDQNGLTISGPVNINGGLIQAGGALKSNNVTFHTHTHGGITTGSGASGPPVPV